MIKLLTCEEQKNFYEDILNMLTDSDDEFCPPLSARNSTIQADLSANTKCKNGVMSYFEELKKQRFVVACEGDKLLGFVSFKENFTNDVILERDLPDIYISTLLVSAEARGMRLTYKMYEFLFECYKNSNVFTRTWSTNALHIKILSSFGFDVLKIITDDRGKGIDTVYFKKSVH